MLIKLHNRNQHSFMCQLKLLSMKQHFVRQPPILMNQQVVELQP